MQAARHVLQRGTMTLLPLPENGGSLPDIGMGKRGLKAQGILQTACVDISE